MEKSKALQGEKSAARLMAHGSRKHSKLNGLRHDSWLIENSKALQAEKSATRLMAHEDFELRHDS